jgi:hypothetical protein
MSIIAIVAIAVVVSIVLAFAIALASMVSQRREFRRLDFEARKAAETI